MERPRILILTVYYPPFLGGVETHAKNLACYLQINGYSVNILTKKIHSDTPWRENSNGIDIYRVPPSGGRSTARKWLMIPIALFAMIRLRRSFDLIYCPGYQGIGIAAIMAGRFLKRPVVLRAGNLGVLSCRNWDPLLAHWKIRNPGYLISAMKRFVRRVYASATSFACICREIEREALECSIPRSKVRYLPNSVDCDTFRLPEPGEKDRIRTEEKWPIDKILCMYVGRLSIEKGILDLLDAWSRIEDADALLVVVGPDMTGHHMDAGSMVKERVSRLRLADRVILHGPSTDIPRLLRAADLFVQPSHYEAFGISVLEAMATGLPVVASRVGGMLDYLVDEGNALFVAPKSPEDIAAKLRRMIGDPTLRERLGREARRTAAGSFHDTVIHEGYARLLQDAVSTRSE